MKPWMAPSTPWPGLVLLGPVRDQLGQLVEQLAAGRQPAYGGIAQRRQRRIVHHGIAPEPLS
jgi:hypothetical protein